MMSLMVPTELYAHMSRLSLDYHLIVLIILSQIAINVFITLILMQLWLVLHCGLVAPNPRELQCCQCCSFGFPVCNSCRLLLAKKVIPLSFSFAVCLWWPGLLFNTLLISFEFMPSRSVACWKLQSCTKGIFLASMNFDMAICLFTFWRTPSLCNVPAIMMQHRHHHHHISFPGTTFRLQQLSVQSVSFFLPLEPR